MVYCVSHTESCNTWTNAVICTASVVNLDRWVATGHDNLHAVTIVPEFSQGTLAAFFLIRVFYFLLFYSDG